MKIAVVGANGRAGKMITNNLVKANADVTAVVRKENHTDAQHVLVKDAMDLNKEDLKGFDVVVDTLGGWTPETVDVIENGEKHLADLLEGTKTRLVVVGGAGSLYTNPEHTQTVADAPDFPDIFKPVASAHQKALNDLRTRKTLDWTYVSPAADFVADGEKTGKVGKAGEDFTVNEAGQSVISYADYADAFTDEVLHGNNHQKRISYFQK